MKVGLNDQPTTPTDVLSEAEAVEWERVTSEPMLRPQMVDIAWRTRL
jgi:hypothetical protein